MNGAYLNTQLYLILFDSYLFVSRRFCVMAIIYVNFNLNQKTFVKMCASDFLAGK